MASLKEVKGRIASVNSTRKITSAMKMVASAKLHKAQAAIESMGRLSRDWHYCWCLCQPENNLKQFALPTAN